MLREPRRGVTSPGEREKSARRAGIWDRAGRVRKSLSRRKLLGNDSRPRCEDVRNDAIGTKSPKSVLNRYFFSPMISELFPLSFLVPKPRISWARLHTFPNYDMRSQMRWSLQIFLAGTVHDSMIPWFYSSSHSSRELIPSASNSFFLFFIFFPPVFDSLFTCHFHI